MDPLTLILIIGGIILGNELLISLFRSHYLSHHKMVNRKYKHQIKENHANLTPDKKRD